MRLNKMMFSEIFHRFIEKWFSADIACCDHCYEDFLSEWPLAYWAQESRFQFEQIDMDAFYSGTNFSTYCTKEEFFNHLINERCPRCGSSLTGNIWCYNLPFNVDPDFEIHIYKIDQLKEKTPFLLLSNEFAKKVFEAIAIIGRKLEVTPISSPLYRARLLDKRGLDEWTASDFLYPPSRYVGEGRFNHAGIPSLYLASDEATCFHELRKSEIVVAKIGISKPLKILDLTYEFDEDENHNSLFQTLAYSALVSGTQEDSGLYKPMYVFTRFIRDCALDAGFDAIKYFSTRSPMSFNLVLLSNERVPSSELQVESWGVYSAKHVS